MQISGNTILITGGATGIGLALAEALVSRGNEVIVCGRRRHKLAAARARVPQIHVRACDLSKPAARRALVTWTVARFPHLNILVNNAGVQRPVDFRKGARDLSYADEELAINLAAPIHLSALLVPHLRRRKQAAIVNISSGLGFTPLAAVPVYSATKAAIHSLSLSIRRQLRDTTVRIFEIAPPIVATELAGGRRRPDEGEHTMTPGEVAIDIINAIEHDRYEVPLGAAANLFDQRDALFAVINE
jgi:uncharacterized oxidoreductase